MNWFIVILKKTKINTVVKYLFRKTIILLANIFFEAIEIFQQEMLRRTNQNIMNKLQSCGADVKINGKILISEPESVCIGNNVHIGDNAFFYSAGGLTIGDNTHISRDVTIYTVNHNNSGNALPYDDDEIPKPVLVGKNVRIGMNVNISPGVCIGDGAIIKMGTTVKQDIPELAIVGNPPIKILKNRDGRHYWNLENKKRYGGINGKLLSESELKGFGSSASNPDQQIFFVVTTGRSGSMTIAHALSQHPEITCFHEPRIQLIRLSTEFSHGLKDYEKVSKELYSIYCNSSIFPTAIYGECDQKFWNLISILDEILPSSKFIWLVRDGRDVVASTFVRGWFSPEERVYGKRTSTDIGERWIYYRLHGAKCKAFEEDTWAHMTTFERNCWYWYYVNSEIQKQLSQIPTQRKLMIRLEDINKKTDEILKFLQVDPYIIVPERLNTAEEWKNHYISYGLYKDSKCIEWNAEQISDFTRWCGDKMDLWYPEWRNQ